MPILTLPLGSEGPLVEVEVGWSIARARALRRAMRPVPPAVHVKALIDSGAETICLSAEVVARLDLPLGNLALANIPALGGLDFALEHNAGFRIIHPQGNAADDLVFPDLLVLEVDLGLVGYQALLGRDVLELCDFLYQGPAGRFHLTYEST